MTTANETEAEKITRPDSARGKLLKGAAHLFNTKGFAQTTVRDIGREVGILSGSIFHHFPNKEALLCEVMREAVLIVTARMQAALETTSGSREKLLALIQCELEAIHGLTGEGFTLLVSEWRSLGAENQNRILTLRDAYEQLWLDTLDEARQCDLIAMDSFILRRFLVGALSNTQTWFHLEGDMTLEQLAQQALQLILSKESHSA